MRLFKFLARSVLAIALAAVPAKANASGLKPILDYQLANDFRSFITNEKLCKEMRKRFEGYIGKPKGEPVIR
jgi:hypothetical protein